MTKQDENGFERWSAMAEIRKAQIENHIDITFHNVFLPRYIQMFRSRGFRSVIDVGAGTGHLAKALAPFSECMTAIEPSLGMYAVAKEVLQNTDVVLKNVSSFNATDLGKFDCAVCHMCAHAVKNVGELFHSINNLVSDGGTFILTIPHPCFYKEYKDYFGGNYDYMLEQGRYIELSISKDGKNIMKNIPYFHRPLSRYLNALIEAGFQIDEFIEEWPEKKVMECYPVLWISPRYCTFIATKPL